MEIKWDDKGIKYQRENITQKRHQKNVEINN